ncbi:hypothetical protein PR202_gb27367 [Eleusine coracana subsp. coracana]|uniref:Uncharacterized protein n=1 Tax=Eleusine coracana subsp. coracana TaxID=191504 RepID=A0AAV5FUK1_ELECO|nr:hypothetical protein PR202_gb27367 [Eleusine coracana subsp. coracana]
MRFTIFPAIHPNQSVTRNIEELFTQPNLSHLATIRSSLVPWPPPPPDPGPGQLISTSQGAVGLQGCKVALCQRLSAAEMGKHLVYCPMKSPPTPATGLYSATSSATVAPSVRNHGGASAGFTLRCDIGAHRGPLRPRPYGFPTAHILLHLMGILGRQLGRLAAANGANPDLPADHSQGHFDTGDLLRSSPQTNTASSQARAPASRASGEP